MAALCWEHCLLLAEILLLYLKHLQDGVHHESDMPVRRKICVTDSLP